MEKKPIQNKKKVLTGFICFLAFMAVCTLVTKGIYTSGMALVTVDHPKESTLTHAITLQGRVKPGQEYGIYVQQGLRVETIYVNTGTVVEAGTPLFQVRMEDLELMIDSAEADIRYRQALLADEAGRKQEEWQDRQSNIAGMQEGYDSMVRELEIALEKKYLAYQAAIQAREREEEAFSTVSGGDADSLERSRLAEAQAALEAEEALLQKEAAVRDWNRQLQDMQRTDYNAAAETVSLKDQLEQGRKSLENLKELYEAEGVVCAREAGMIVDNRLRTGEYTPDTACMLFIRREDAGVIEFVLDELSLEYLSTGDSVELEYRLESGEKICRESVISYMGSQGGNYVARAELSDAQLMLGQRVTLKCRFVTEKYSTVIPGQALVEEDGRYYVYVVEEQEGFLGTEDRVRKVNVALADSNTSSAAVESGAVHSGSRVVITADRELTEGDAVRVRR